MVVDSEILCKARLPLRHSRMARRLGNLPLATSCSHRLDILSGQHHKGVWFQARVRCATSVPPLVPNTISITVCTFRILCLPVYPNNYLSLPTQITVLLPMEDRKHQCLLKLNKQSVDRLALATVEDNNGDIARTICAMIFLPAVADSSLLPPYWMILEEPWYRLDVGGSDELCETCQQQNVTSAIEFLNHLERQGEDRERWAPTVALMIGAC